MGKSSTFAPAFGRNEGARRGGSGKRKFFDSLRPAQDQRRGDAARGKEPFNKGTQENIKAEPEIQRKTKAKDNSTTKSLILAQDER